MSIKCTQCKKKIGFCGIDCKYCGGGFCSRCIQLEIHACSGMSAKKIEEIINLGKKLPLIESKKI